MTVTYKANNHGSHNMLIYLQHRVKHVLYIDVGMPPKALQMIQEQAEWSTPSQMATKIQLQYPQVTTKQIHSAWRGLSQEFWHRDDEQLPSTQKLLSEYGDEVDIFEPVDVPEGVEILAWRMKKIAEPVRGKVVEIGMDATCESQIRRWVSH